MDITFKNLINGKTIKTELEDYSFNVLIGKNGYGKTSFLNGLKDFIEKNNYHCVYWSDMEYGRDRGRQSLLMNDNINGLASMAFRSEGETLLSSIDEFFIKKAAAIARKAKENDIVFLLLDQIDSGLDIHQIGEIKYIIKDVIIPDMKNKGINVYAIVSANSYELVESEICINPRTGKKVKIKDYNAYKQYISKQYKSKSKGGTK